MPPQQGEVSLLTLFADVHYYFSPPSYKPPHHRFDKGSYVYLYHNPMQQRGRIEVANHAGTLEQDAFAGHLDTIKIEQTFKHPCLFTLTVDSFRSQNGSAGASPQQDLSQWHLPVPDPNNNGKYMYKIHTLDIYFWTVDDSNLFLDSLRRVAQPHQLHIVSNTQHTPTPSEHKNDLMNPVVAKLEKAAISHSSRSPSISTTQSYPGPPAAPAPTASPPKDADYTPLAYNPAAPAAPEPIAHREKTPPPPDAADGTGLSTVAMHDQAHAQQYGNPLQTSFAPQSTSQPYMPGPPSRTSTFSGPPAPGIQRTNTTGSIPPPPQSPPAFAPPPAGPPPGQYDAQGTPQPGIQRQSTLPTQQYATYANSPGIPPAVQTPGAPGQSPMPSPTYTPQPYQPLASPPPGGYTQFQYGSTAQQANTGADSAAMHQQLYRPTEHEASTKDHANAQAPVRQSGLGKRADQVEKGARRIGSCEKDGTRRRVIQERTDVVTRANSAGRRAGEEDEQEPEVALGVIFFILLVTYALTLRMRRGAKPKSRSQDKLPSLFSWKNWRKRPRRNDYSTSLQDNELDGNGGGGDREMSGSAVEDPERQNSNSIEAGGVDRNTSVRSVMTLPAYSPAVRENERVLAREGERGGIDIVVEYPETHEEEEARRDGEMESLYQIRLARRQEAREREERRQARRDARARGDIQALAEIRRRAEQAAEESVSQMLIAEHQGANRERRVSAVQYSDLGVARHDGTRLRANSSESDNRPLLDSAASISGQSGRSRAFSNNTLNTHYRNPSASSMMSVSSRASEEFDFPDATHTRSNDTNDDFEVVSLTNTRSRSRSASRGATPVPLPSIDIPREEAPAYEDPPNYESPVATRAPQLPTPATTTAPQLPTLERLPSIRITEEPTPVNERPQNPPPR
ncbi:hypothetical protein K458DRAFT_438038 [Lentithecium fluviatile CBS 122367]|uniref:Uncharacterized protein n=1 Tax=Lentithecium fluviatile CBS 122367 TaxID=1168545 RepID=A0A6G1JMH9_9PLEO|nr:hypothetical protein K458DRAFT_438038 [Lentithecium fluviatile CBS 122367]